jgi:hypothetical protein
VEPHRIEATIPPPPETFVSPASSLRPVACWAFSGGKPQHGRNSWLRSICTAGDPSGDPRARTFGDDGLRAGFAQQSKFAIDVDDLHFHLDSLSVSLDRQPN